MVELRISPTLSLPIDAATGTFGILATKGAGKSNAAVVMAEEMYDVGVPWVAVDPKGDWYGIRSSADGKGPGLPIPVLGGRHGDVPLDPHEGQAWADVVLRERLTCVLDVSQFTKADTIRFLQAFGAHLFRHADDDGAELLHLFLEEAHEYLPQQVSGEVANLVGTWQRIVKQGRFKGLGASRSSVQSPGVSPKTPTPPASGRADRREKTSTAPARVAAPRTEIEGLPGPQRKLLIVLATYGPRTKRQLALQSGYVATGGAFNNPLGRIRALGYVEPPKGEPIAITDVGLEALGDFDPLPTGHDLLDHWLTSIKGPERKLLLPLVEVWPGSLTKTELAAAAGYEPTGGAFNNPLGKLRTLELVTRGAEIRLTDDFGEAIGG